MRMITEKYEYLIECPCGGKICYKEDEIGGSCFCRKCNLRHMMTGEHEQIMMVPCKVYMMSEDYNE